MDRNRLEGEQGDELNAILIAESNDLSKALTKLSLLLLFGFADDNPESRVPGRKPFEIEQGLL